MEKLTQEQRQKIEDALNTLPENLRSRKYGTMEGIEEQLARGDKIIFYMSALENEPNGFSMHKMKVGEDE